MKGRMLLGLFLVLLGLVLSLAMFGFKLPILSLLKTYWPVLLILAGIAFFLNQKAVGALLLVVLAVVLVLIPLQNLAPEMREQRDLIQSIPIDHSIDSLDVDVDYGAGKLKIHGEDGYQAKNRIMTSDLNDPLLELKKEQGKTSLRIARVSFSPTFGKTPVENWDIGLYPVPMNMTLNYGAADVDLDLRDLKVEHLQMNGGAANAIVTFSGSPINVKLGAGMSSIMLKIPSDASVIIMFEGGMVSTDFKGFTKEEGTYSRNIREGIEPIVVDISAGMSDIKTELY